MDYGSLKNSNNGLYEQVLAYFRKTNKLDTNDYLSDIDDPSDSDTIVEVRFKNTHKGFYNNSLGISLRKGDIVAVESHVGHDIGIVSLTGYLAKKQFDRKIKRKKRYKLRTIYRKARISDLERFVKAKEKEIAVRNRAREIARNMGLDMKISDAEFQGDNTKVTFYYLADKWIDFRELIRHFANEFQVKIEMKQIGARQEAALIGGFNRGGRELCGSLWKTDFESVKLSAAKVQQLSTVGNKLLGPCGKLKSSLNYELDIYLEAWKDMPSRLTTLETVEGTYYPHKRDVLHRKIWYSTSPDVMTNPVVLLVDRVNEIIHMNKNGHKPSISSGLSDEFQNGSIRPGTDALDNLSTGNKIPNKRNRKKQKVR